MKQLQKHTWLMGLAIATNSLFPIHAHAEEIEENSTEITGKLWIGGFYDLHPYGAKDDFSPAAIPLKKDKNCIRTLGLNLLDTKVELKKKFPLGDNPHAIEMTIQAGLSTTGAKLKKAYVTHDKFIAGLNTTNFADSVALPAIIFAMPSAFVNAKVVQIGWKDTCGESAWSYGVAIEEAKKLDIYPKTEKEKEEAKKDPAKQAEERFTAINNIPALSAHVKYEEAFGHVRLAGLFRTFNYNDKQVADKTQYMPAGGANITAAFNLIPEQTTLKIGGIYGMGIGSYLVDFSLLPENETKDVYKKNEGSNNEALALIATGGGYIGIEHELIPTLLSFTLAYSILDTSSHTDRGNDAYKQGHYTSANLAYHPIDNLTLGLEYFYGRRFTIGDKDGQDAHRIQAAVGFEL